MRLLLLSEPRSSHTLKWVRALDAAGVEIHVFGLSDYDVEAYRQQERVRLHTEGFDPAMVGGAEASLDKLQYLGAVPRLRRFIKTYRPDILHAHYATSYGLLGALAGFRPFVLSVWGSDVYDFPRRSLAHEALLRFNLSRADRLLSTSHVMAKETSKYTRKPIEVTPFGVDLERFQPQAVESLFNPGDIVIGTVKTLHEKYGIEYLIRAFRLVKERLPDLPLRLLIVGGGPLEQELKALASRLGLDGIARFTGPVPFDQVPCYHNMLDISVSVSVAESESFGVAIVEASACEKPVVVARIGGLPEVVEEGVTGLIVPPRDAEQTAVAIERMLLSPELRTRMGKAGRERVRRLYDWNENVRHMLRIYEDVLAGCGRSARA
jgi:L-malate glycosyltransferase